MRVKAVGDPSTVNNSLTVFYFIHKTMHIHRAEQGIVVPSISYEVRIVSSEIEKVTRIEVAPSTPMVWTAL